jgi:dTDP-4-amino-4,6-dideoxygalactose transaminase
MGEIGAAMGIVQLERLPDFLEHRERIYGLLEAGMEGIDGLELVRSGHDGPRRSSFYCLAAVLSDDQQAARREELIDELKRGGVGTSVYYPKSLPDTAYYAGKYGYARGSCPAATRISKRSIAFPVGPHVTEADVDQILFTLSQTLTQ